MASARWPTVGGTVVRSAVVRRELRASQGGVSRTEYAYDADVRYAYTVAGRRYESATFATGVSNSFADRAAAEARVTAHPVGSGLAVHHDPREPSRSTIVTAPPPGGFGRLNAFATAFAVAGLAAMLVGLHRARAAWRTMREWTADPHAAARRRRRDAGWM